LHPFGWHHVNTFDRWDEERSVSEESKTDPSDPESMLKAHLEMWRHYDSLRQAKNSGFTTANTVLVAITGILFREAVGLIAVVAILGIVVSACWFLLLDRNTFYIEYHRKIAGDGNRSFWTPPELRSKPRSMLRSKYLTTVPSGAFFLFWVGVLVWSLTALLAGQ
jgi:hypothetical protein